MSRPIALHPSSPTRRLPPEQPRHLYPSLPPGGPVDIIATLRNGLLVDPTDRAAVGDALLKLLTDSALWEQCAAAGRDNINAYSWWAYGGAQRTGPCWPSHDIACPLGAGAQPGCKGRHTPLTNGILPVEGGLLAQGGTPGSNSPAA